MSQPPDGSRDYAAYPRGYGPPRHNSTPLIVAGVIVGLVLVGVVVGFVLLTKDAPTRRGGGAGTGTTSGAVTSTTPTVFADSCEDLGLTCPSTTEPAPPGSAPDAGSEAPTGSGDSNVDALAQGCFAGDMQKCDDLYLATANGDPPDPKPALQAFFDYGFTCGDRLTEEEVAGRFCVEIYP